ncbi:MAG TPA: hypothetical protein VHO06_06260 [Polyangia bacterium]|nr:hypothetical protein [Polyangia bacterium]
MDETPDEALLRRLEEQIERETEALIALRRRTRTVEIEVAAWPPPQMDPQPRTRMAQRTKAEMFLGVLLGSTLTCLLWAIATHAIRRHA